MEVAVITFGSKFRLAWTSRDDDEKLVFPCFVSPAYNSAAPKEVAVQGALKGQASDKTGYVWESLQAAQESWIAAQAARAASRPSRYDETIRAGWLPRGAMVSLGFGPRSGAFGEPTGLPRWPWVAFWAR